MKKPMLTIICTIFACFSMYMILPTFAGTWRDDFEDNDTREWKIYNLNRQAEKWWINDNEAVGEIFEPGFMSLWLTGDLKWKNYSVSCRAKLVDDRNEPPTIGLTLHDRGEEDSRYLFFIDYVFDIVRIVKAVHDDWSSVRHFFTPEEDTWYQLKATVYEDGNLEFSIQNLDAEVNAEPQVFTAFDPDPLPGGQAGLVVADARVRFDDVEITGANIPNGGPGRRTPQAVSPRSKLTTTWGKLKMR
ncbi:MAG: hypothetical protein OXU23_00380 [Candidatus Poribacteria bacterium]|nr:hypothetical protein [Candidatus Poribacteria bacterium]